ncbi:hypothetical protein ABT033_24335 [Streptomyces pharetrae]|uniref:hypothetical protein n=1 Tax=Streptomyces pharetrae TaxID=291370 RepID=UPI003347E6A5
MTYEPCLGDLVEDTGARRIGKVIGILGPYVRLRLAGGGTEWDAEPGDLRKVSVERALSAAVSVANARSRGEVP